MVTYTSLTSQPYLFRVRTCTYMKNTAGLQDYICMWLLHREIILMHLYTCVHSNFLQTCSVMCVLNQTRLSTLGETSRYIGEKMQASVIENKWALHNVWSTRNIWTALICQRFISSSALTQALLQSLPCSGNAESVCIYTYENDMYFPSTPSQWIYKCWYSCGNFFLEHALLHSQLPVLSANLHYFSLIYGKFKSWVFLLLCGWYVRGLSVRCLLCHICRVLYDELKSCWGGNKFRWRCVLFS